MNKKIVHSVFERIAATFPDRNAVEESCGAAITYRDLNCRANIIGSMLVQLGVGQDTLAGVLLPTGIDYAATILGTLKAGGMFMPLDLGLPRPRMQHILSHTTPGVIVTDVESAAELRDMLEEFGCAENVNVLVIDGASFVDVAYAAHQWHATPAAISSDGSNLAMISEPDDSCYVIYTSGSTGVPKYIEGWHKGLAHYVNWQVTEFGINETSRISQMAPVTFEASLKDYFVALCSGATLCIPSMDVKKNPARLIDWIETAKLSVFQSVPSYLRLVIREVIAQGVKNRFPDLKLVLQSGDTLYGKDVHQWRHAVGEYAELVNLYGPAEVTLLKSFHRILAGELKPNEIVPIGTPISNTVILIMNGDILCQPGKIGELCVKSPFITKGYYRSPELTAEKFVQNPLNSETGDIIFRTGDLGRYRSDAVIEFVGRVDSQVKVHGNRIELAEIENVLHSFPKIDQAVVVPHRTDDMENILACYYTEHEPTSKAELRELVLSRLPDYMLPAYFIRLEHLPLSLNGKVNRRALPKPEDLVITTYIEPVTATEKVLAKIWSDILGLARIGLQNSFIEIGGDSLKAIQVISRIYRQFAVEVSVQDFFASPTIYEMALFVDAACRSTYRDIPAVSAVDNYELSQAQRRLWILNQIEMESASYNIASSLLIEGEFSRDAFSRAVRVLHARHDVLRTTFVTIDGTPRQRVAPPPLFPSLPAGREDHLSLVSFQDISAFPDPEQEARRYFRKEASSFFNLATGPLCRITLLDLGHGRTVFVFVIHHIISDVWSMGVMTLELSQLYNSFIMGENPDLPLLAIQYRDFAAWQNSILAADVSNVDRDYWLEKLAGPLPLLVIPADFPRPPVKSYSGATIRFHLDGNLCNRLRVFASEQGASLFALLLSLVRVLLFRYAGQDDLLIGSPVAGRTHQDLEPLIGFFVNTLVLRDQVAADESFVELLARVMATNATAFDHQNFSFDLLVDELNVPRDVSRSPVFDLMVVLQNAGQTPLALHGVKVREFEQLDDVSKYDLSVVFREMGEVIQVEMEYNRDLFLAERIRRLSKHLVRLTEGVLEKPFCRIRDLSLLTDDDLQKIIKVFNRTDEIRTDPSINRCIHQLFEAQVSKTPDAVALVGKEGTLSYAMLNARSNQMAHYLNGLGVKEETVVGIFMLRSLDMIVALMGVLKSGAAYLPLDHEYPQDRLGFMLDDSDAMLLLTQDCLLPKIPEGAAQTICFDSVVSTIASQPEYSPDRPVKPDQLAYVIYTSGSTGKPKGVAIEHRSSVAFLGWARSVWSQEELAGVLAGTSICFDLSIFEIFLPLSAGGMVILAESVLELPALNAQNRVTLVNTVPSAIDILLRQRDIPPGVRVVNLAGEPLTTELADRVYGISTVQKVYDLYGPSECTTYSTFRLRRPGEPPTIGRPIDNTQLYILDHYGQPTPIGVPGELYIGGAGLARGYINRPELTAEKFIPDHFSGELEARLYRTGDLARYRFDGSVEFLGRLDHQIKIRGYRVEPGEVEAVLGTHPAVREAVVVGYSGKNGEWSLVAYVVPSDMFSFSDGEWRKEPTLSSGELRDFLSSFVPNYMIPSYFVALSVLPLTSNGKLDRKALPDPRLSETSVLSPGNDFHPARTETEQVVARVWEAVLGQRQIGIHDNYFASGGDSIRAIQIASRLQQMGLKMMIPDIFHFPTIAELAGRITKLERISDQNAVSGAVLLTPVQRWFFEQYCLGGGHYNQSLVLGYRGRLDEKVLSLLLGKLVKHHDALRMRFISLEGDWKQENLSDAPTPCFEVVDLVSTVNPVAEMERHAVKLQTGFDLAVPPLISAALYRLPDSDRLLIIIHHLVVDGVSWRILTEDLVTGYQQLVAGRPLQLPGKSDSFKLWSERLSEYSVCQRLLNEKTYWQTITQGGTVPLPLPTVLGESAESASDFDLVAACLNVSDTEQLLNNTYRAYQADTADLLLTALAITLQEWTGSLSHLITLEGHGREDIGTDINISRTVGWFTTLFPHFLVLADREDIGNRIRTVKEALRAVPNHGLGYGVLRWLTPSALKRGLYLHPLPRICFNYFGNFDSVLGEGEFFLSNEPHGSTVGTDMKAPFDLEFGCSIIVGKLSVNLTYGRRVITVVTAQKLVDTLLDRLRELIVHCCGVKDTVISPSDISYDGFGIDELDAVLEGLSHGK